MVSTRKLMPKYPIYIPTKGRSKSRLTIKALNEMRIDNYYAIVEEQEYNDYSSVIDKKNILILDKKYQENYETCDDLGLEKSVGPGAARNYAWDHSIINGYKYHWVMDDNIKCFLRYNKNSKIKIEDGSCFYWMELFTERYSNCFMSGPNYSMFVPCKRKFPPYITNTRIYSCNLIKNNIPYRWRGRYNEDTDLSLRILKDGFCTIQFYAFLQEKVRTQTLRGGNTDAFYAKEGTAPKSRMLYDLHPDVTRLVIRYGREHHHVNYHPFKKNKLIKNFHAD